MGSIIDTYLKDKFRILEDQPVAHAHLNAPLTGIGLTDEWAKLPINETDFEVVAKGGFTFDEPNNRFIWDAADALKIDLDPIFIGDAGLEVTAGGVVNIILGFFVDGNLLLETELDFDNQNKIQSYGANEVLVDGSLEPLLQQGSYIEVWAKAGPAQTPTINLVYFNITTAGR